WARHGTPARARHGTPVRMRGPLAQARRGTWGVAVAGLTALGLVTSACANNVTGDATAGRGGSRVIGVGAAETLWGSLVRHPGDNPHLWYNPAYVTMACDHIEADLKALDPKDAAYFTARRAAVTAAFAGIRGQLAQIHRDHAGQPVAATESIFAYLATYLGL